VEQDLPGRQGMGGLGVAQTMYTCVSKCKNNKIQGGKKRILLSQLPAYFRESEIRLGFFLNYLSSLFCFARVYTILPKYSQHFAM
jgi:hypothetical protein